MTLEIIEASKLVDERVGSAAVIEHPEGGFLRDQRLIFVGTGIDGDEALAYAEAAADAFVVAALRDTVNPHEIVRGLILHALLTGLLAKKPD